MTTIERLQCGAFAGLVAQTVTYPIEVVRRRMQTLGLVASNDTAFMNVGVAVENTAAAAVSSSANGAAAAAAARSPPPASSPPTLVTTVRNLYLEQGIRGFYKGVAVNWMKGPVAFSISFTTFDYIQHMMETDSERARRLPGSR